MDQSVPYSKIMVCGSGANNCGYCKKEKTSHSFGIVAKKLTCETYQQLIDHGWRRSGTYLYKPDLKKACCPQYTIRLDSSSFQPNKAQRKVIYRFNKIVLGEQSKKTGADVDWSSLLEIAEKEPDFSIQLEKSSYTEETFELYKKYQISIHKDSEEEVKPESFQRFLVDTPLKYEFLDDNEKLQLGSFHQKYYFKEKLIAIGVIDILPQCVSSVYFMYDVDFGHLSLGKYSAMVEANLSIKYSLPFYYLGFYIHTCPKMKYKASYQPSYLLDPVSHDWYPFLDCVKLIEASLENTSNGYTTFEQTSVVSLDLKPEANNVNNEKYNDMIALLYGRFYSLGDLCSSLESDYPDITTCLRECFDLLGSTLARQIVLEVA